MHQAGAAALTQLLQYDPPDRDHRTVACSCGHPKWHAQIGDPTLADSILDRLVHAAHRIELRGDSMLKNPPKAPERGKS